MRDHTQTSKIIKCQPIYLSFLTLAYSMVIVLANWFDVRLIHIFGLDTDAGTLIFPFTFLLSDLITEVYGFKYARIAIWTGFLFNAIFIIYGQIVIHLPSPAYPTNNHLFDVLLSANVRIIIASAISYLIAEPLNSMIMAKLKVKMNGEYMGLRFILSTVVAAGVDSFIFTVLAFSGIIEDVNLIYLMLSMWFIKLIVEIAGLPLSIRLAKKLKKLEKIDIYDKRTRFNIFSLDAQYTEKDNLFYQKGNSKC